MAKTEKSSKNRSFEVITLSSDEEESGQGNKDVNFLFKRFILACRPHVPKETIKDARSLFTEVQGKLTASHHLVEKLERYCKEIKKENADLYLNLICRALDEEKSENNSVVLKSVNVYSENINKVAKSVTFCDVSGARGLGPSAKLSTNENNTSAPDIATISDDDDFVTKKPPKKLTERIERNMPSTSSGYQDSKTKISTKTLSSKQKKKLAARLKQRLKEISNEIKILNRAELTLEEMDMCDSTYIQENRLKKKFEKTWNKLCKVLGRLPNTGRVVEKSIRASSTGYSMIDKAIAKFLKEKPNSFPDYFDIRDIVLKTNQKHELRMSPQVLNGIIADIFTDIGNKLQRRRERDLLFNFGSHVLDDFKAEDDPALTDEDLARQLEKNRRISKRKLKQVYAKYTHLERYQIDDKSQKSGSSRLNEDMSNESATSDDEQDHDRSRNHNKHTRLDRREVMGKSKMRMGSSSIDSSRGVDWDINGESSSSDNEQENDNSFAIEDSDVPTSQEFSFVSATAEISTDMSLSTSHVEQLLSDTDCMDTLLIDNECPESPTFPPTCPITKQNEIEKSEQMVSTFHPNCSNDNTRTNQQTFSSSSDCEIISNPNEQKQLVMPANKPSESQAYTNYDCEIVNESTEQLVTRKLLDEPVNKSVLDKQPNTNDDCEIVNDPKQQLVTVKVVEPVNKPSADEPANETYPNTDDECLIIDDDQDDPPNTSHSEPLKIQTSTPSEELLKTLNVLREVFQIKSGDQSKVPSSSCDESDTNSVSQTIPHRVCASEDRSNVKDLNLKPGNSHSVSQTNNTSKPWLSQSTSDNCGNSEPECVTLVSDNDTIMSDNDQRSTSDSLKDNTAILTYPSSPELETNHTIPSTTSNALSTYSEAERNSQLNQPSSKRSIEAPSTKTITSNLCHSPSSSKPASTSETSNVLNSRKRKATTELAVQISKSSVKCLEQIAWALKNKKLKLPDDWMNSNKAENNSHASLSKPTTSKESSTLRTNVPALSTPAMSKRSTTQALSENNSQLVNGNAKIDLHHRQVFREKTLNALKVPTKPVSNGNVNGGIQSADVSSSSKTASNISLPSADSVNNEDELEVIIIDD